jgi:exopolysaccharide biosynthesis predicted pyruvyltransferase EpsI
MNDQQQSQEDAFWRSQQWIDQMAFELLRAHVPVPLNSVTQMDDAKKNDVAAHCYAMAVAMFRQSGIVIAERLKPQPGIVVPQQGIVVPRH